MVRLTPDASTLFWNVPSYRSYSAKPNVRRSPDVEQTNDPQQSYPAINERKLGKNGAFRWLTDLDSKDRAWSVSTHRLADSEEIALAVLEPGGLLANAPFARVVPGDLGDAVDRPQARKVVFFEHHSTRSQPLHRRLDVFDLPRHLGVISRGGASRLEERELPVAAPVKQASRPFLARFETQLLRVERFGPLQILHRDPRCDFAVAFKHSLRPSRLARR